MIPKTFVALSLFLCFSSSAGDGRIVIFVGDSDQFFPLSLIKETKEALNNRGFQPEITIIKRHDHNYYDAAAKLNRFVWDFLKEKELASAPRYEKYDIR